MERFTIGHDMVALVVRGKKADGHNPGINSHADCLLPGGNPVGYFGDRGTQTSGNISASWHSVGMNKRGQVIDYARMKRVLIKYTDLAVAQKTNTYSTILIIKVDAIEAIAFKNYWRGLNKKSDGFRLLGNNCSTHASKAFIKANIVKKGIPGLDTPDNLYKQLKKLKDRKMVTYSGYIGHIPGNKPGHTDIIIKKLN